MRAPVRNLSPLNRRSFTTLTGLDPRYFGLVAPGRSWKARLRRWVWRKLWRLLRLSTRKGWARRRPLAPWAIAAAAYLVAAVCWMVDHGWITVLAVGAVGTLPLYWWLGLPAWKVTRRRNLKPTEQRIWYAAAYASLVAWTTLAAGWRLGPPMPGVWLALTLAVWIRWMWHHRTRSSEELITVEPVLVGEIVDDRMTRWLRVSAGPKAALPGSELENIVDLDSPKRWECDIDLPSGELTVEDVMSKQRRLSSLWSTRRDNVIVDVAASGAEDRARMVVVLENPTHQPIEYDESWQDLKDGCVPFHTYPDGHRGWIRLWLPRSGTCHSFFSGDTRSGKSAGIEAGLTLAAMTGRVWPMVGDPQGGQSLPAWCRADGGGAARSQATTVADVCEQLLALREAMYARSHALQRMRWEDEDGEHIGLSFFDPDLTGWPVILYVLEEAHIACKDPEHGPLIIALVEEIVKMAGKTGIILWLANQYPGIEELGNKMAVKQNLSAGNTICYRNSATSIRNLILPGHMPSPGDILPETPEGEHTKGTAIVYSAAPRSSRATHSRSVWVKRAHYWAEQAAERIPELDPAATRALARVTGRIQPQPDRETAQTTETGKRGKTRETVFDRIEVYLRAKPGGWAHTGVIADAIDAPLSTVSTTLGRAEKAGKAHQVRHGIWALGPATQASGEVAA